jgi:hypothetical protein
MLLLLLTAVFLRFHSLTSVPPGLTHDEADHGITALSITEGARDLYFTIGYGREPLYDYAAALLMTGLGPTFLAGRLTAVFASLLLISGMAAWVRRAFGWQTAVLTAAGLATGFWPLMTARQSLRSGMLPAVFVLAVYFFWRGVEKEDQRLKIERLKIKEQHPASIFNLQSLIFNHHSSIFNLSFSGLLTGLTFYTYIPARILWLLFPLTVLYLAWQKRPLFNRIWRQTMLMLGLALLTAAPLLLYLLRHPDAESRIGQLSQPLTAVAQGNFAPLWQNIIEGAGIIAFSGDSFWRYNIAGQPLLPPLLALLFTAGVGVALVWVVGERSASSPTPLRPAASFLALLWLLLGLSPVLVTGARLSTTQAIGMQPILFLFPAIALQQTAVFLSKRRPAWQKYAFPAALLLVAITALLTFHRYFHQWAARPEVRVEYETTMVTAMGWLNENGAGSTAVSTITPHPFHTPAVAAMTLRNPAVELSWFDGRTALLLPAGENSSFIFPGFASLNPALERYFETAVPQTTLPLRPTDLDRPLTIYQTDNAAMQADWAAQFSGEPLQFGEEALFLGYDLQTPAVQPGDVVSVATWWQAKRPLPDAVLFTQILGDASRPITQADRLDVPGALWQAGDQFIQLHQFTLPEGTPPGEYPLVIGLYRCPAGCPADIPPARLPIHADGLTDYLPLTTLIVSEK